MKSETLYIIGDGFDLLHRLKTKHVDFWDIMSNLKILNYSVIWNNILAATYGIILKVLLLHAINSS